MVKIQSTTTYLLLLSIFFVIKVNCEKPRDDIFGPSQGNSDNYPGSFQGGKSEIMMEPNIFKRFGSHLVKGWHGFKSLFGRQSNRRREENNFGREEKPKPFEKETQGINKEYPESNYNNYGNGNNGAYGSNQGGQKGNQEENQGYQVGVDERYKGGQQGERGGKSDKDQKEEDKIDGIEETSSKPSDRIKGEPKGNDKKSPEPVTNNGNSNFETDFAVGRAYPAYKQRSRRRAPATRPGSFGLFDHLYNQRFKRASGEERTRIRGIHRPRHYENPIRSFNHIDQRANY